MQAAAIDPALTAPAHVVLENGRVFDTDTHVLPAAEIIERYVDPDFRPRLEELEPYRTPMRQSAEYQGALHGYRVQPQFYRRVLGEAAPRPDHSGRDTVLMGAKVPRPGVHHDNASNRIADMVTHLYEFGID